MTAAATSPALCSHCLLPIRRQGHERELQGEHHRFCCYGCCLAFQVARGEGEESEAAWLLIRLGTGAFLSMNVMLFSLLLYSGTFDRSDADVRPIVHLLLWALATPCTLILGWPLFQEAWQAAVRRRLTSASLISLGAGMAYAYSTLAVLTGAAEVYFDTATMLLVLYTLGRYLEAAGRARAMRNLAPMLAVGREQVTVLDGGAETRRLVREVIAGTLVLVRPGERIGVDGIVVEGSSFVDEAVITGESQPLAKVRGPTVLAGGINYEIGLDRDDTVVRRRLQQKMEFVGDELAAAEPNETELQAFLAANRERFRDPERWSFRQVLVASEVRDGVSRAEAILASLRSGEADPMTAGDATLLQPYHENLTARDVAGVLGEEFARALGGLPVGVWAGPVRSPYGLHLIEVTAHVPARDPTLAEVRPKVLREWQAERSARAKEELYVRLRSGYEVMIELPPALDGVLAADGRAAAL